MPSSGFTLSALPVAPSIPSNLGEFDSSRPRKAILEEIELAKRLATAGADRKAEGANLALKAKRALADASLVDAETADRAASLETNTRTNRVRSNVLAQGGDDMVRSGILSAKADVGKQESELGQLGRLAEMRTKSKDEVAAVRQRFEDAIKNPDHDAEADELERIQQDFPWIGMLPEYKNQFEILKERVKDARTRSLKRQEETAAKERAQIAASAGIQKAQTAAETSLQNTETRAGASRDVARITASGAATNKAYGEALQRNEKIQEELQALKVLDKTAEAYLGSALGSGPVVGSKPMITLRSILGDDTGKNFVAATSQSMKSAVETMRGLGAMSEKEFQAAMSQLPETSEPESAIRLKLEYLSQIRPWIAARNNLYMDKLEQGFTPIQAGEAVRRALPMPTADGAPGAPASADQFEVGKQYTDAQGNKATYLGEGRWQEAP